MELALVDRPVEQGDGGAIVNIASINARQASEGMAAYCCSKAGVEMFTKVAAMEFAESQLRLLGFNGDSGEGMDFGDDAKTNGFTAKLSYREIDSGTYENWNVVSPDKRAANSLIDDLNRNWAKRETAEPDAPHAAASVAGSDDIPF